MKLVKKTFHEAVPDDRAKSNDQKKPDDVVCSDEPTDDELGGDAQGRKKNNQPRLGRGILWLDADLQKHWDHEESSSKPENPSNHSTQKGIHHKAQKVKL